MVKVVEIPDGVTPVTSRAAAEILKCSMGHVRNLALMNKIKSWKLGPRSIVFDLDEIKKYRKDMEVWRKEGHRGRHPGGFQPD